MRGSGGGGGSVLRGGSAPPRQPRGSGTAGADSAGAGAGLAGRFRAGRREAGGRASRGLAPAPAPAPATAPRAPAARPRGGTERGAEQTRRTGRGRRGGMEQGGRRAFGSICPNRAPGPPARGAKKPARTGGAAAGTPPAGLSPRGPAPRPRRGPAGPASALSHRRLSPPQARAARDWQELTARGPVLPAAPVGPAAPPQVTRGPARLRRCESFAAVGADPAPSPGFIRAQGPCLQDEPEFDFQDLRDAVDYFISGK